MRRKIVKSFFKSITDNEDIKWKVKRSSQIDIWRNTLEGKHNIKRQTFKDKWRPYHTFNKSEGRMLLLLKCGLLHFRGHRTSMYKKKNMDTTCPFPLCPAEDTYIHATQCLFNNTRLKSFGDPMWEDYRIRDFLIELNAERIKIGRGIT